MSATFISYSANDNADADAMVAWLSNQGHTYYFTDYDEKSGFSAGRDREQVLYRDLSQCQAVIALVTPSWLASKWCFSEIVQARFKGKPIFPVMVKPCDLPGLLSENQSIDLTSDKEVRV